MVHDGKEYSIDELVFRYQQGDEECGEKILRIFGCHPADGKMTHYVGKYYKMLKFGKIDFDDRDTRKFIACYMADDTLRNKMKPFYQYRNVKEEARRTMQTVQNQVKAIEDEDFEQDLRMLLLIQAMRYKKLKKNVDFTGYLYNSYGYALKNHLKALQKSDPYMGKASSIIRFHEDHFPDEESDIEVDEKLFAKAPMIQLEEDLGNSWVRGLTCGDLFKDLTPLQRMILKLRYQDGITDGKIGDMMGIHINTIFRQRKKAIKLIEEAIEQGLGEN